MMRWPAALRAALALVATVDLAGPAVAEPHRGAGAASFSHGARRYRLPLETLDVEEVRAPGGTDVHVSLVFRDARNRLLALAFVHRGPGRAVAAAGAVDLTASTPSGLSRYDAGRSRCEIHVRAAGPARVEGRARCRELAGFGGASAPDVTDVRFTAREVARSPPPSSKAAPRRPG